MSALFNKPVRRPSDMLDRLFGNDDPAEASRAAHATATALLSRVREDPDADTVDRLVTYTREHGIDTIAQLWSQAPARTLPGALWRIYLLQLMVHDDPHTTSLVYERGRREVHTVDPVIAGAPTPAGPGEITQLADAILRGVFTGDFGVALQRAASFCRVEASGATHLADDYEGTEPERATALTTKALRLSTFAADLDAAAAQWRLGTLT
ncbi:hypothetical protein [Microbacterium gorillae]|uniref:hypothetical protein n=1 Tax=Microbacterium gorillae TaxID=1231063 RepID=UPI00058F981D|nr:hypothetical protein [Microbacterium gorillae]